MNHIFNQTGVYLNRQYGLIDKSDIIKLVVVAFLLLVVVRSCTGLLDSLPNWMTGSSKADVILENERLKDKVSEIAKVNSDNIVQEKKKEQSLIAVQEVMTSFNREVKQVSVKVHKQQLEAKNKIEKIKVDPGLTKQEKLESAIMASSVSIWDTYCSLNEDEACKQPLSVN